MLKAVMVFIAGCLLWSYPLSLYSFCLEEIVAPTPFEEDEIAAFFVNAETGEEIFSHNAEEYRIPASNIKLFTTAAGLYYLGADSTYETTVYTNGKLKENILTGDLIIVGTGDPSISARFYPDYNDPRVIFFKWGDQLKEMGIEEIQGNIIADDTYFDDQYFHPLWYSRSRAAWYQAEVSALSFNDNCIDITVHGGSSPEEPSYFRLAPPTDYIRINNQVSTTESRAQGIRFQRNDRSNLINITGSLGVNRRNKGYASVYNPPLYFVTVLKETLQEMGIKVHGTPLSIRDSDNHSLASTEPTKLLQYTSPHLSELIYVINQRSQNLFSELLLKTLGKEVFDEGSFKKGARAVKHFLNREQLYQEGFRQVDGSGLSNQNRVSPETIIDLLAYQRTREDWDIYFTSLPQGGRTGSLRSRFNNTELQRELGPFVYGKTGYIRGAVTLSGIITGYHGDDILFSVFLNDYNASTSEARNFVDTVVVNVLSHTIQNDPVEES